MVLDKPPKEDKMKKLMKQFVVAASLMALVGIAGGCTENERAKNWGGHSTVTLPKGHKLVNVTWKESNLWYLSRPMKEGEAVETYTFKEDSSWGVISGTVTFVESK